jgi:Kef-type K+ transport system membrane component KefB
MTVVPPLSAEAVLRFLVAVAVLLLVARVLGGLSERAGLPRVVGELITGVLLGPSLLGLWPDVAGVLLPSDAGQLHLIDALAQLGVLLLVGVTGTHLDVVVLRRLRRAAVSVSLFGLVIPLSAGVVLGLLLPLPAGSSASAGVYALFLGVAMAVTALPVIAKTLTDMRLLHRTVGQLTLAAGTIDDVVGWFLLSVAAAAAAAGVTVGGVELSVAYLAGFILLAATAGRWLVRVLMGRVARAGTGATVAAAVIVVLAGSAATAALGMEPVFGAFVAGLLLGGSGIDQAMLAPLRTVVLGVLAPLFLATAGLRVDLAALGDHTVALVAVLVLAVAIVGKFTGAYLGARLSRLSHWEGLALGAGMNSRGVIEIIVAMTGLRLGILDVAAYTTIVLVAVVTSVMAPPLLRHAMKRVELDGEERMREVAHRAWGVTGEVGAGRAEERS